jgi:L-amino acid N-acyltransferase YncA
VEVRALEGRDESRLHRFFHAIPIEDRAFFKDDIESPAVLRRWIDDERSIRLIAIESTSEILAIVSVWPGVGRSAHVGDLRLIVAAEHRRQGLGQLMARHALAAALRAGIWKLTVEVVSTQQGTIDMFLALGFVAEALLRDHLCSDDGTRQDVVLLSHLAEDAGADLALAAPEGTTV